MRTIISTCLLLFTLAVCSQNTSGKAYYVVKQIPNQDFAKDRKMPEHVKQRIQEMQNKLSVKQYVLAFSSTESLFTEIEQEEEEENPANNNGRRRGGFMRMMMSQNSGTTYKDIENKKLVSQKEVYEKQFLIKDNLPTLEWVKENEVKVIGNYTCFKATTTITKNIVNREGEEEQLKIPITAWYTIQIPVGHGPEYYWGLPGLILEMHEGESRVFACSKIEFGGEEFEIEAPKKGKKISLEKYEATLAKKTKEVQEMMEARRNRRGGGGPGRR